MVKDHSDRERKTCFCHMGYSFWLATRVLLYAPSQTEHTTAFVRPVVEHWQEVCLYQQAQGDLHHCEIIIATDLRELHTSLSPYQRGYILLLGRSIGYCLIYYITMIIKRENIGVTVVVIVNLLKLNDDNGRGDMGDLMVIVNFNFTFILYKMLLYFAQKKTNKKNTHRSIGCTCKNRKMLEMHLLKIVVHKLY